MQIAGFCERFCGPGAEPDIVKFSLTLNNTKQSDYITKFMPNPDGDEDDDLKNQISFAFNDRLGDLDCDIDSAAYVLDPQFARFKE